MAQPYQRTRDVTALARGHWRTILSVHCPELAPAMQRPGRHVTCPLHNGKNDFRLREDFAQEGRAHCTCGNFDGFHLLRMLRGWSFPEAVAAVEEIIGGNYDHVLPPPVPESDPLQAGKDDQKIKDTIKRWWAGTLPLDQPAARPARLYLKNRQIGEVLMPLEDIGFHPSLALFGDDRRIKGNYPALVSIVRTPEGKVSTVHRTYITEDGRKAFAGEESRKQYRSPSTNPVVGSAIRIDKEVGALLNLAEGIETALAVRAITRQPTWSTLNKELLKRVLVPEQVRLVTIWADRDHSQGGQEAAIELMDQLRSEGIAAVVMLPPFNIPDGEKGVDWNDVVARLGLERTKDLELVQQWVSGSKKYL